jgi:hypothetical protein
MPGCSSVMVMLSPWFTGTRSSESLSVPSASDPPHGRRPGNGSP